MKNYEKNENLQIYKFTKKIYNNKQAQGPTIMDQNSNVNLQVVQVDFPIKYGPKTFKHPWLIFKKKTVAILWLQFKILFFYLFIKSSGKKIRYIIRYTFQSYLLSKLVLDLGKCPKKKTYTFIFMHREVLQVIWTFPYLNLEPLNLIYSEKMACLKVKLFVVWIKLLATSEPR